MNAQLSGFRQMTEPVAGGPLSQRQHGLRIPPLQIALLASFLLALNPGGANGNQLQNSTDGPQGKTVAAHESLADGQNRSPIRIQKVELSRHEQRIEVRVEGNAPLSYNAFPLSDPDRVVLDFSGALVQMERKLLPSNLQPVRGARIGQFKANVARVVIDLESKVPYTLREDPTSVTVVFEPDAGTGLGGASDAKVAFVPSPVLARLSNASLVRGKRKESLPERRTHAQAVRHDPTEAQAKPSSSALAEARPAEAQRSEPAARIPSSERTSVADKAEPESPSARLLAESMPQTSSEKTLKQPGKSEDAAARSQEAGSASTSTEAHPDRIQETHSSAPGPLPEAETKEKPNSSWAPADEDYVIGIEDVLAINVWKEPDISRLVFVRPDGKISLPLIGELKANGLTPRLLQDAIGAKLRLFLFEPEVTVIVQEIRSQRFNIVGEVNRPGTYPLSKPMTVLDAIALAGGFRDFARVTQIYVLRLRPDGSRAAFPFNYKDAIRGLRLRDNLELEARDTIVVP